MKSIVSQLCIVRCPVPIPKPYSIKKKREFFLVRITTTNVKSEFVPCNDTTRCLEFPFPSLAQSTVSLLFVFTLIRHIGQKGKHKTKPPNYPIYPLPSKVYCWGSLTPNGFVPYGSPVHKSFQFCSPYKETRPSFLLASSFKRQAGRTCRMWDSNYTANKSPG